MSIKGLFADFRDYVSLRSEPEVRDFFADFDWPNVERNVVSNTLPCVQYLDNAEQYSKGAEQRLVRSFVQNLSNLQWLQSFTAADFGQGFVDNYGFVELMGPRGHFDSSAMSGGILLIGPGQHFPSHHQVAEELLIPLTNGAYWMRDGGPFQERQAGEVILHESNETHAIETPASPLLALYAWRDGDLSQKPSY